MAQDTRAVTDHPTTDASAPESGPDTDRPILNADVPHATPDRPLSEAARRALMEAAERRAAGGEYALQPEHGGPRGPEPTRYGDWEKKGLAIDF
nr:DUF1674 domain-containing protein [Brevundimonas basaltis]